MYPVSEGYLRNIPVSRTVKWKILQIQGIEYKTDCVCERPKQFSYIMPLCSVLQQQQQQQQQLINSYFRFLDF
jgi:hypothetical protein